MVDALARALAALAAVAAVAGARADAPPAHADRIATLDFPAAEAPENAPALRLDLRGEDATVYAFQQRVEQRYSVAPPGVAPLTGTVETETRAKLLVRPVAGARTAEVVLRAGTVRTTHASDGDSRTDESELPQGVTAGLREDGTFAAPDDEAPADPLRSGAAAWFAMPDRGLAPGASVERPAWDVVAVQGGTDPARLARYPVRVEGTARTTLTRYVWVGRRLCAQLDTEIVLDRARVPERYPGSVAVRVHHVTRTLLDVSAGRALLGASAGRIAIDTRERAGAAGLDLSTTFELLAGFDGR